MRKVFAILLLNLYLFGATDAYQLLKLPLFVKHFIIHKQQSPTLTIADFLQIHYNDGPLVVDDDFKEDMQLPFKKTEATFSYTTNILEPPVNPLIIQTVQLIKQNYINKNQRLYCFVNANPIFQPPRF